MELEEDYPFDDEVEVVCVSCGKSFFILREHFEADLCFEDNPEYVCLDCNPDQIP